MVVLRRASVSLISRIGLLAPLLELLQQPFGLLMGEGLIAVAGDDQRAELRQCRLRRIVLRRRRHRE